MAGKNLLEQGLFFLLIITTSLTQNNQSQLENINLENEISMIIDGTNLKILYEGFNEIPSEVLINGEEVNIQNNVIQNPNVLISNRNNITIRWNRTILYCSSMFYNLGNIISIDLSKFFLSNIISTEKMFYNCKNLSTIIFPHDSFTINVENMKEMFYNCHSLKELNLEELNIINVKNMEKMFYNCYSLVSLNLSNFDTSKVTNMNSIFYQCKSLISVDISNFDLTCLSNGLTVFNSLKSLNSLESIKANYVNISQVRSISSLFYSKKNLLSIDLSYLDASSVTSINYIFAYCENLIHVNLFSVKINNIQNMENAFYKCYNLIDVNLSSKIYLSSLTNMRYMFAYCKELISLDLSNLQTERELSMHSMFYGCIKLEEVTLGSRKVKELSYIFYNCNNLKSLDLSKFQTEKLEKINSIFDGCNSLTSLDLSNWKFYKVTFSKSIFSSLVSLKYLKLSYVKTHLTSMNSLFSYLNYIISLDLRSFVTSSVKWMYSMFYGCSSLISLDLTKFDTSQVMNINSMFYGCSSLISLDLTNFDTSQVINMNFMFYGCSSLTYINLSNFITSKVQSMNSMFYGCFSLTTLDLSSFDTSLVTDMNQMFYKCSSLISLNLSNFNTPQINNINNMFAFCTNIEYINLQNFKDIKLMSYQNIFYESSECFVLCINDNFNKNIIFSQIGNKCITFDCSTDWKLKSKIRVNINGLCYDENNTDILYKYEYNGKYYENCLYGNLFNNSTISRCNCDYEKCSSCPKEALKESLCSNCKTNFYPIENDTSNIDKYINCYKEPIGYYLDIDIYRKCYNICDHYIQKEYKENNITRKILSISSNAKVVYECKSDDNSNSNCNFQNIENNTEILNIIKENIVALYSPDDGKSQVIKGENNTIFQITSGKNELELLEGGFLNNQNISILDLGECENTLKEHYHINESDSLIILKKENTLGKPSEKNVEYEVFDPYNFKPLNLSICKGNTINIYVKAELSENTRSIYENMKSLGYDMLNINDPFYQDICIPYKNENNTDILLSDRINYIYNNKDSQCQSNCQFSSYLKNSLYLNCTCEAGSDNVDNKKEEDKFSGKKLYESFFDVLKYSNFKIIKCYNLVLSKNVVSKNFGSIIIMVNFSIYLICLITFIIKGIIPLMNQIKIFKPKRKDIINNFNKNNIIFE